MPFNWTTPIGYSIAIVLQLYIVSETLHYVSSMLSLAIGSFFFSCSLVAELKNETKSYNQIISNENKLQLEMRAQLCERIQFSYMKRWVQQVEQLMEVESGRNYLWKSMMYPISSPSLSLAFEDCLMFLSNSIEQHWQFSSWAALVQYALHC